MISSRQRILWTGLLVSATFAAAAQTPPPAVSTNSPAAIAAAEQHRAGVAEKRDDTVRPQDGKRMERMQERRAGHLADLKTKLKLDASQQGAWSTFTTSIQRSPMTPRPDRAAMRAEFEKLTTPQRLDRMQARQAERAAAGAKRADATRTFYAALKPEQQKTFDAESMRFGPRGGHGSHGDHRDNGPRGHGDRGHPPAKS